MYGALLETPYGLNTTPWRVQDWVRSDDKCR